jgi:hypothetical protein
MSAFEDAGNRSRPSTPTSRAPRRRDPRRPPGMPTRGCSAACSAAPVAGG